MYGKIHILEELTSDITPCEVFESVSKFYHQRSDFTDCFVQ